MPHQQNLCQKEVTFHCNLTGSDDYTCQMISRVSQTTVGTSAREPSNSSSLVNVMESKSQCEANLKTAQPCSSQPTYIAGNSQKIIYTTTADFVNVALFENYALLLDVDGELFSYDYTTGIRHTVGYSGYDSTTSSMAVDAEGVVYIITDCAAGQGSCITVLDAPFGVENDEDLINSELVSFPTRLCGITNDNEFNLYVFDNRTVYSMNNTSGSISPIFNLADFDDVVIGPEVDSYLGPFTVNTTSIYSAAVYYDQVTHSTVVYCACKGAGDRSELYMYNVSSGSSTIILLIASYSVTILAPIVAGSVDVVYFAVYSDYSSELYAFNSSQSSFHLYSNIDLQTGDRYRGLGVSTTGDRLLTTSSSNGEVDFATSGVYMGYPSTGTLQTVLQQSFFAGAWFMCGDSIKSPVPQTTPEYGAKCPNNGFVGN